MRNTCLFTLLLAGIPVVNSSAWAQEDREPGAAAFRERVEPLFRRTCYSCHGPEKQEGGLRLDVRSRALAGGDSGPILIASDSARSRVIRLVSGTDEDLGRMPPEGEGTPLSVDEIEQLRRWIDDGAIWPADATEAAHHHHWSFQPVSRPKVPDVADSHWALGPIDRFILARLQSRGIAPSREATRHTLVRRVYLDLIGLPPSPDEVRAFVEDSRPDAYERMVDRVLASPHYGERWARHWLDLARYADSDGYEKDRPRPFAWRYRDWVIDALNRDDGFDQFSTEQIAGDLLPEATTAQRIATGFHRNTLHNTEGGIDPEEDRFKKTVDRTNTFGAIWLGVTVGCAQCHSHKYDPLTQREYYSLFAFFNSLREDDLPVALPGEREAHERQLAEYERRVGRLEREIEAFDAAASSRRTATESALADSKLTWSALEVTSARSAAGAEIRQRDDGSLSVSGANVVSDVYTIEAVAPIRRATALRLEVLPDDTLPANGPGRSDNGNFVLTTIRVTAAGSASSAAAPAEVAWSAARADFSQKGWDVALATNDNPQDGWAVSPQFGKRHVAVFQFQEHVESDAGEPLRLNIVLDHHYTGPPHNLGRFRLSAINLPGLAPLEDPPAELPGALAKAESDRTPGERSLVDAFMRQLDSEGVRLQAALESLRKSKPQLQATPTQVIAETATPNDTHLHGRGEFLNVGERVGAGTPEVLPPMADCGDRPDRLDLARWLFDDSHPLAARVAANRLWSRIFGRGLVATVDDFGKQGEPPTHPDLLDWLSAELRDADWSVKHLHRLMVTSAVYRQASTHRADLVDVDPENELLARQNRFRVEAEIIRDLALAAGGQWDARIGGPSVRPPQPSEYSELTYANSAKWTTSDGGDRYRRGMYTFFQRTSPYPMLMTFDSPDSTECTALRDTSNTPLQALTLWNDPVFFASAQALGLRLLREVPADAGIDQRIDRAFMICLGRPATPEEQSTLAGVVRDVAAHGAESHDQLAGSDPRPPGADASAAAAWIIVARILMNVDEFITRE